MVGSKYVQNTTDIGESKPCAADADGIASSLIWTTGERMGFVKNLVFESGENTPFF